MLAGLNPIIEDNIVGYFYSEKSSIKVKSKAKRPPYMKKMNNNYKCINLNNKIAVLIDTLTASSGEMTAISLLGIENSRSFGHRSRGATILPIRFKLSNGSSIFLSTKYFMDRNKKIYREHLEPDIVVDNDNIIQEAIKWIKE